MLINNVSGILYNTDGEQITLSLNSDYDDTTSIQDKTISHWYQYFDLSNMTDLIYFRKSCIMSVVKIALNLSRLKTCIVSLGSVDHKIPGRKTWDTFLYSHYSSHVLLHFH